MSELLQSFEAAAPWAGMVLLVPIFLANALGVLDQSVATRELASTGVPARVAALAIWLGRVVQLLGAPCLFFQATRPYAAVALAAFLVGATLTAHAFWKAAPDQKDRQLANFLKNMAMVGGLLLAAGWT
jgi:uncharacterized membrane protein YphA (DoxX/SURF4 family)